MRAQTDTIARLRQRVGAMLIGLATLSASGMLQAADTIKGKQLYTSACAICHGAEGKSAMPGATNFDRGDGLMRPDFSLLAAIRVGKNAMPGYQGIMTDRDSTTMVDARAGFCA